MEFDPTLADQESLMTWDDESSMDELTALALAADPNPAIDQNARPFRLGAIVASGALLPEWYMPSALSRVHSGWRKWIIGGIVVLLFGIEASGLCSVFGQLVIG